MTKTMVHMQLSPEESAALVAFRQSLGLLSVSSLLRAAVTAYARTHGYHLSLREMAPHNKGGRPVGLAHTAAARAKMRASQQARVVGDDGDDLPAAEIERRLAVDDARRRARR